MEADIIYAKMESLTRCLQRLEDKTPASKDILATDCDIQDIIVVNLERTIQQCFIVIGRPNFSILSKI